MPPKGPFPREYQITHTRHLRERSATRQIDVQTVETVIRTGSERPKPGRGVRGGVYVEFSKTIDARSVVVIAEILGQQCFVLTTYEP